MSQKEQKNNYIKKNYSHIVPYRGI